MKLKDRVSLVTGGSRGIGRAIALTFAREGSHVVINYVRNKENAEEVASEITEFGGRATTIQANVAVKDDVFRMVNRVFDEFGRIDILVNNAGITLRNPNILEVKDDEWGEIFKVNLLGVYYCIQAVAPYMIKQKYGKIINISSIASIGTTIRGHIAYASSKAAINILTRRFAYELGPYNINVNAIAPGLVKTEMLSLGRSEDELMEFIKEKISVTALRRIGEPQDIANIALFLASDDSSFITGQVIIADGGRFDYLTHSI